MTLRRFRSRRLALTPVVVLIGVLAALAATATSWHAAQNAAETGGTRPVTVAF